MKKNFNLMLALLLAATFGVQTIIAQFPSKIPKIRKTKQQATTLTSDNASVNRYGNNSASKTIVQEKTPALLGFYVEDISKAKQSIDRYTPTGSLYLVNAVGGQWLLIAVSPRARQDALCRRMV